MADKTPFLTAQSITSYDFNNLAKDAVKGLAWLTADVLGSVGPVVTGFGASQTTSPSMSINLAIGRIYQLAATDANPIGLFAADSTQIVQQGYAAAQAVALNASGLTAGQAKWWLVQAQFQQVDQVRAGDPTSGDRGFYNSANPAAPLDGVNGLGGTIPTVRLGFANVTAIAGAAATSGSAVPPNPSAGCVPLFLIQVTYGQTTITTGQIQPAGPSAYGGYQRAPFLAGLLNQHHLGILGQAPQIDLTTEVKNVLPLPNLPVTNTTPPALGGNVTLGGVIPVSIQSTVNPNTNIVGNKGDQCLNTDSGNKYECTTTGNASTAVWTQINGAPVNAPTVIYVAPGDFSGGYTPPNTYATYLCNTTGLGNGNVNLPKISTLSGCQMDFVNVASDGSTVTLVPDPTVPDTINFGSNFPLNVRNMSATLQPPPQTAPTGFKSNWSVI